MQEAGGVGEVEVRFYGELNDLLPPQWRARGVVRSLEVPTTVKDLVEGFGVAHTDVDVIVVDGESAGFDRRVGGGERIAVYPVFESFDVRSTTRLRSPPLRQTRFVVDGQLGRLAQYLRLLGFDTWHIASASDAELVRRSVEERRILLTRDRGLLMRKMITHALYVREDDPRAQLQDVVRRLDLAGSIVAFSRCMTCNGHLESVPSTVEADRLPPRTRSAYDEFWRCRDCERVYRPGAHHARLQRIVSEARAAARP